MIKVNGKLRKTIWDVGFEEFAELPNDHDIRKFWRVYYELHTPAELTYTVVRKIFSNDNTFYGGIVGSGSDDGEVPPLTDAIEHARVTVGKRDGKYYAQRYQWNTNSQIWKEAEITEENYHNFALIKNYEVIPEK